MAILNSIRKRGIFLILIIAMALFAFILSDILTSGAGGMPKGQNNIANVNGVDIPRQQFMEEVEIAQRNMGANANTAIAVNRVWEKELRRVIYEEQMDKVGISVEKAHLDQALRETLAGNPTFLNEAGQVDEGKIQEYIASIKTSSPQMYQQWIQFEEELAQNIKQQTYENLIKGGIRSSNAEGKQDYHLQNDKINFTYVLVPYASIDDEEVSVSDREIEQYVATHASEFKTEATVDFEYVVFTESPSEEDAQEAREEIEALLKNRVEFNNQTKTNDTILGFKDVEDYEEFLHMYSEVPYQDFWFFENNLPESAAKELMQLETGEVYGPYKDGDTYFLSRVIDTKKMPDSVASKHILIRYEGTMGGPASVSRTKEEAEKLVDSLVSVVKRDPSKFSDLARDFSDDPSKNNGGDLGISIPGRMVPTFDEFIFNNPEGTIGKVETDFGFHVVEVGEQSAPKKALKLATVVKPIEASDKTLNDLFSEASKFEVAVGQGDFTEIAKEKGLEVRPVNRLKIMDANIPGIGDNRPIVTWAFDEKTKVGESKRFNIADGYVIARLTRKNKEGLLSASEASTRVKPILMNEKKAAKIRQLVAGKSMEEIAKDQNVSIKTANGVTMANPTIGSSLEPKVVGYAFGTKTGETSDLIDGNQGVYMVKVRSLQPAPNLESYANQAYQLGQKSTPRAPSKAYEALKNKAKIKDHRANFY